MEPITEFIVAIEIGSSKIAGIAGQQRSGGGIQVLAFASEDSSSFIRKGVVYNLDKTAQALTSIINRLEGELGCRITQAYVGVSGQSLHTEKSVVVRDLQDDTIISQSLVDAICDENRKTLSLPGGDMILEVVPQEYKVGVTQQIDPVGVAGKHIEGSFVNIVIKESVMKNLRRSFEQAQLSIAEVLVSPLILANAVLSEREFRIGCALIDLGAETTTVAIFKNDILRNLSVIPLGGNNITRDITNLSMEETEAEGIKKDYGCALIEGESNEDQTSIPLQDGSRSITLLQLDDIINARAEEIVANVLHQIELSEYKDQLLAGIILTGGGANLRKIDELLRQKSSIKTIKTVRSIRNEIDSSYSDTLKNGSWNTLLGLLSAGEENCAEEKTEEIPQEPVSSWEIRAGELFPDDKGLKEQAEKARADKKQKQEEEKLRKKEEKRRKEEEKRKKKEQENLEKAPGWFDKLEKAAKDLFTQDQDTEMK